MRTLTVGLSTYRITKLVLDDYITEPLREKIQPKRQEHPKLDYFLSCPWCISVYAGVLAVAIDHVAPELNTVLAASAMTGIIYTHLG